MKECFSTKNVELVCSVHETSRVQGQGAHAGQQDSQELQLAPNFSEEFGPRQSRPVDDDSEGEEAAELDAQDINMPSLSFPETNSVDYDYVDRGKGCDLAPEGTGGSDDEEQDENVLPSSGMEFVYPLVNGN